MEVFLETRGSLKGQRRYRRHQFHQRSAAAVLCHAAVFLIDNGLPRNSVVPPSAIVAGLPPPACCAAVLSIAVGLPPPLRAAPPSFLLYGLPPPLCRAAELLLQPVRRRRVAPPNYYC